MQIELINKQQAYQKYLELKDIAHSIAEANGTLPGYCNSPECKLYVDCAGMATELKEGEVCVFINGYPAHWLTDFSMDGVNKIIGKLCTKNLQEAYMHNELLHLKYADGVVERYSYLSNIDAYKFLDKNISINVPSTCAN